MPVSDEAILQAAMAIAGEPGFEMDPDDLLEDVYLLAGVFPDEREFMAAIAATTRAIRRLVSGKVSSASLKYAFEGWSSFHYQHRVAQGMPADCRIVFRKTDYGIEARIIGHRRIPVDIYERMANRRSDFGTC